MRSTRLCEVVFDRPIAPRLRPRVALHAAVMERPTLSTDKVSPYARDVVAGFHRGVVDEVAAAVAKDRVVVVGMAQNPVVKRARKMLDEASVSFTYLEYGSYFSKWKERLAIKLW